MICISKEYFEGVVLSATEASGEVFQALEPHFVETREEIERSILGSFADQLEEHPQIEHCLSALICLQTYRDQIPQLDLVLTPTGFGVVNNQNVAPASADRVKALLQRVSDATDDMHDHLLELLVGTAWAETSWAVVNIPSIMYTARIFRTYTEYPKAHRTQMQEHRTRITAAEEDIRMRISSEVFEDLLDKVRRGSLVKEETLVVDYMLRFIGFCVMENRKAALSMRDKLENYVVSHKHVFKAYEGSQAEQVKNFEHYENKQEDSTFFFG